MGFALLRFLVLVQLVIALAFFSGQVTADQVNDAIRSSQRAALQLCNSLASRAATMMQQ